MTQTFPAPDFAARRDRLRPFMAEAGLSGLLVSAAANRFYLSGFELHDPQCDESSGLLLIGRDGEDHLLTDTRYTDAALRVWEEKRLFIYQGARIDQIRDFLKEKTSGLLGFDGRALSYDVHAALAASLSLQPASGLVERLRKIKEPGELERMRASCRVNHEVMRRVPALLHPGKTEKALAWEIEQTFRELGADEPAFAGIVAFGPNGALPHAIPGLDRLPEQGPVLVDVGGRFADYCSDQTRCFWVGEESGPMFRRWAETKRLVLEAQAAGVAAVKPGASFRTVYHAAKAVFEKAGAADRFTHGLGHGVGLQTHEAPSFNPRAEGTLEPGMVVTVEPGLYYPEWGGVRWEFMTAVTETGVEVF